MIHPEIALAAHELGIHQDDEETDNEFKERVENLLKKRSGVRVFNNLAELSVTKANSLVSLPYSACSFAMKEDVRRILRANQEIVQKNIETKVFVNGITVRLNPKECLNLLNSGEFPDFMDMLKEI